MARTPNQTSNESEKSTDKTPPESTTARSESSAGAGSGTDPNAREAKSESKDATASKGPTLVERLKSQHRALQAILDKRSGAAADPQDIARQFAAAWVPHDLIVRDVFGSAPQKAGGAAEALAPSDIRKDLLNFLLVNLLEGEPRGAQKAALNALADEFAALLRADEEGGFFQVVELTVGSDGAPVSQIESRFERARQRFERLDDTAIGEAIELLAPRRLSVPSRRQRNERERSDMSRYSSQSRDRDEQGRFTSEDDRDYGRSGQRGGTPNRDEAGRFISDDERHSRGSDDERRSRSRYDDERRFRSRNEDDDRSSSGRDRGERGWFGDREGHSEASRRGWERSDHGESGWYGDREGHSEASRRGWENPDHGRSGWFGDREGHSQASRRGWENSDHGQSGWYGDREGHSQASRRGWENSDHGQSGWYGDREGHSEASRRGWDEGHRSQQRRDEGDNGRYERAARYEGDDDRRSSGGGYESRRGGRYEDDDDRRSSSRGQSGWSGDPEGHSEASRRGWERRR